MLLSLHETYFCPLSFCFQSARWRLSAFASFGLSVLLTDRLLQVLTWTRWTERSVVHDPIVIQWYLIRKTGLLAFSHKGWEKWKVQTDDSIRATKPLSPLNPPSVIHCVWAGNHASHSHREKIGETLQDQSTNCLLEGFCSPFIRSIWLAPRGTAHLAHDAPTDSSLPVIIYILIGLRLWWILIFVKVKATTPAWRYEQEGRG